MRVINYKKKPPGKGEGVLLLMFSNQDRMSFWKKCFKQVITREEYKIFNFMYVYFMM